MFMQLTVLVCVKHSFRQLLMIPLYVHTESSYKVSTEKSFVSNKTFLELVLTRLK